MHLRLGRCTYLVKQWSEASSHFQKKHYLIAHLRDLYLAIKRYAKNLTQIKAV